MNESNGEVGNVQDPLQMPIPAYVQELKDVAASAERDLGAGGQDFIQLLHTRGAVYTMLEEHYNAHTLADVVSLLQQAQIPQDTVERWLDGGIFAPGDTEQLIAISEGYPQLDKVLLHISQSDQLKAKHAEQEEEKFLTFDG